MGFQHSWCLAGDNHWWLFKHWDPVLLHNVMDYVSTNMLYTSTCQQGTTLLCPLGSHQRSCPVLVVLLISRMPGTGRERRDKAADVDRGNGRRSTGRVTTR